MQKIRVLLIVTSLLLASALAYGQQEVYGNYYVRPNQQILLHGLHLRTTASHRPVATLASELETVFENAEICCGRNSTFSEIPDMAGHTSLQEIGAKLGGRHVLSDGRPIMITAQYLPGSTITSYELVTLLANNERMLVEWDLRLFVVRGVVFDDKVYDDGHHDYILRNLLLLDPSNASPNHEAEFDRTKDDWSKVQGFLLLRAVNANR